MLIVSLGLLLSIVECLNSECDSYMTYLSVFDNISKWVMPSQKVVVFPVHHTHIEPLCQVQKSHAIYLIMRCELLYPLSTIIHLRYLAKLWTTCMQVERLQI